jgi:hypothetical protein
MRTGMKRRKGVFGEALAASGEPWRVCPFQRLPASLRSQALSCRLCPDRSLPKLNGA